MTKTTKSILISFFYCTFSLFTHSFANELQQTTELRKLRFEQTFAEQCVEKEIINSINKEIDRERFTKPCSCIAKRIIADLPASDAEKYLSEQKVTQSLSMSFDKAAYFCLQKKKPQKTADLFGRK